jgi:peptidyl-prolyl cis-trans isomerase D
MLLQMRNFTRSWISYLLLFLLSALFVVFLGNGQSLIDMFQVSLSTNIASGRGVAVSAQEVEAEFTRQLNRARQENPDIDREQALAQNLHGAALNALIGREAGDAFLDRVGVHMSERDLDAAIRASPIARGPISGAYDAGVLTNNLRNIGLSYEEFRRLYGGGYSMTMLQDALVNGARAPSSFGRLEYTVQTETRIISVAEAPASVLGALPQPTEAQLQEFWQANQARWRTPEFRALTLVAARPQAFEANAEIDEAQLQAQVDARMAADAEPERRDYVRITVPSEALARQASARLARGEDANAIAAALGSGARASSAKNHARGDVPDAPVAAAVFATARGAQTVVQGALSWSVVRVDAIAAPVSANREQISRELRAEFVKNAAQERMEAAVTAFDEARDGGADAASAARQAGLEVVEVPAINDRGQTQDGAAANLAPALLQAAFTTNEGEASDYVDIEDAQIVVAVERVIAATVRPLGEVRDAVARGWLERERQQRLQRLGERVSEAIAGGQNLAAAARANGLRMIVTSQPVQRATFAQSSTSPLARQIPGRLAADLFGAREGDAASAVRGEGEAVLVAVLESIHRPDPAADPQAVEASRQNAQQALRASLESALQDEIIRQANVRRDEARLRQMFGLDQDEAEQ